VLGFTRTGQEANVRRYSTSLLTGLLAAAGFIVITTSGGCQPARAMDSFELGQYDHILAESPGCQVECRPVGGYRRSCMVRNMDCKPVCMDLPECNVMNRGVPKVCAIMKMR
jgi:hypothetical protein